MNADPMIEALSRACIKIGDQAVQLEDMAARLAAAEEENRRMSGWIGKLRAAEARCELHETTAALERKARLAAEARADRYEAALREIAKETCVLVLMGAFACRLTDNPCGLCRARAALAKLEEVKP